MMRRGKTVAAGRAEAAHHLAKAGQFLEVARAAVEGGRYDAGMLNAIHAGISAADAVTVALVGERSADPDHQPRRAARGLGARCRRAGPGVRPLDAGR
jgi:hypothetical protein